MIGNGTISNGTNYYGVSAIVSSEDHEKTKNRMNHFGKAVSDTKIGENAYAIGGVLKSYLIGEFLEPLRDSEITYYIIKNNQNEG